MSASGNRRPPKKSKVQACATCRKVKARCEVLEANSDGIRKCHRCTAVKITCSFESEPLPPPPPPPPAPSLQPLLEQSSLDLSSSLAIPPDTFPERLSLGVNVAAHPRVNLPVYFTVGTPSAPSSNDVSFNFRPLWAFVGELVDWSTPILAIQELAKVPEVSSSSFVVHDKLLQHILSQSEVDNLLSIFTVHYTPWLNFSLVRNGSDHVFLDLVCCTIASRYLDASTRFLIAPRLQNLIKDKIAEMVFNPSDFQSLETVQALIILALWSPICGFGAQGDGKMLIGMAVTIAMNMRLHEASAGAMKMRADTSPLIPVDIVDYENKVNQARIWTVLTNTESMICVGSGRQTISKRSPPDLDLFPILSPATIEEGRDLRIRLSSELFNAAERGLQAKLLCREQIEEWFDCVSTSLEELDGLVRLIKPLPIVCTDEKFHFHVLHCLVLCCRQCILYNAVLSARNLVKDKYPVVHGPTSLWAWFEEIRPHGLNVIPQWGKESTRNAEAVLTFFLQCDRTSLATSPDILFAMIAFCGGLVVAMKLFAMKRLGQELDGSGDMLLEQTIDAMSRASMADNHAPIRYANVVRKMLTTWRNSDKTELINEARRLHHGSGDLGISPSYRPVTPVPNGIQNEMVNRSALNGAQVQGNESDFWSELLQSNPFPQFASSYSPSILLL